jgi:hypothetical protein
MTKRLQDTGRGRRGCPLNFDNVFNGPLLQAVDNMASSIDVSLPKFKARRPNEFDASFSAMTKNGADAIAVNEDAVFLANDEAIAALAVKNRFPSTRRKENADVGGFVGYGLSFVEMFRCAAYFVTRGSEQDPCQLHRPLPP